MTSTAGRTTGTANPAQASRSQGQWALGEHEPLNPNEKFKLEDDALNVRARVEQVYAKEGFDSITAEDLHGRLRWWGLYTQRKQGIDGGKTATLEPEELEDKYFMLRVRIDGGALTTEQLRVIGEISRDLARDSADLTDRQNIQLHWVRIEDAPQIWSRLEAVGLQTTEACGDCPRVVLGSPVAGISKDELIDPTWAIEEIKRRFIGSPDFSNLPRKFKTALSGTRSTTSPSSVSSTPSWARALTCGSAAGCPPTRAWPSASASSSPSARCPTSGPAWSLSSGTTATGGCGTRPG